MRRTSRFGRSDQALIIIGVLAVLRFGSGAGVPVLGPTTSVLPTHFADAQTLPVEDAIHLSLLGLASGSRKDALHFPSTAAANSESLPEVASEYSPS